MNYKNFEDFINYKFAQVHPEVLDDDMPDRADQWIAELDCEQWLAYGDEYAQKSADRIKFMAAKHSSNCVDGTDRIYINAEPFFAEIEKDIV